MVEVAVVIAAFNEAADIEATVKSYADSLAGTTHRIIVVDDGSIDDTATIAQAAGCEIIKQEHAGASAARNAGASAADDVDFLMFSDAHMVAPAGWFQVMHSVFSAFDKVGAVGPQMHERGEEPKSGGAGMSLNRWWPVGITGDWFEPTQPIEVPIITSGAQMWRTKTFWNIGGYDADFNPIGLEDVEISLRAWRHGYTNVATPLTAFGHRFKEVWDDHDSTAIIANELRLCVLHWPNDRLAETLKLLGDDPRFDEIVEQAFSPSTLAKRKTYQNGANLRLTDEWLAQSIPANIWTIAAMAEANEPIEVEAE